MYNIICCRECGGRRESGGTGRRARLRGVWLHRTGSSPVSRTKKEGRQSPTFFFVASDGFTEAVAADTSIVFAQRIVAAGNVCVSKLAVERSETSMFYEIKLVVERSETWFTVPFLANCLITINHGLRCIDNRFVLCYTKITILKNKKGSDPMTKKILSQRCFLIF